MASLSIACFVLLSVFVVLGVTGDELTTTEIPDSSNATDALETGDDLVSGMTAVFETMRLTGLEVSRNSTKKEVSVSARMKMSDIMFNPVMLLPQLIMWGFAPIVLANLQMFVMHALMINKMALSSAIFMTLRNIVFGPRPGPLVKYANYGYKHKPNHYHRNRR
ncbi:uncharacterized protein LOC124353965 [Homalodisca vitripennis]|uniref:uncharacterized protein LOC124353965 n=1 Tax=Homalodisca vitripennis TaxID=197043 RepID=UPI001EEC6EB9|nr:uncharacterized protein LOC124353965 [Homalodisca vitripennis]